MIQTDKNPQNVLATALKQGWIIFCVPLIIILNSQMNRDFQDLLVAKTLKEEEFSEVVDNLDESIILLSQFMPDIY